MSGRGLLQKSSQEPHRFNIINDFIKRKISRKEAALLLEMTESNVTKILRRIENKELKGILHRNSGKQAHNKTDKMLKGQVLKIVKEKYFDFNVTHCKQILEQQNHLLCFVRLA